MDVAALQKRLQTFADDRDWNRFHCPKNLAMALSVEVAELVEIFQWLTEAQSSSLDSTQRQALADEIADVQIYLLRLAAITGVDIETAVENKLEKNARKYPPL
jgi:NTP pyrophosphatase (non-canonical NTP hydrolase)